MGPIDFNRPDMSKLKNKLNIIGKGTTTSDIEGATPKRFAFAAVFKEKAVELRQVGAFKYENKSMLDNGDIIANRFPS